MYVIVVGAEVKVLVGKEVKVVVLVGVKIGVRVSVNVAVKVGVGVLMEVLVFVGVLVDAVAKVFVGVLVPVNVTVGVCKGGTGVGVKVEGTQGPTVKGDPHPVKKERINPPTKNGIILISLYIRRLLWIRTLSLHRYSDGG